MEGNCIDWIHGLLVLGPILILPVTFEGKVGGRILVFDVSV